MMKMRFFLKAGLILSLCLDGSACKETKNQEKDILAKVKSDGKYGFINRDGQFVIEPTYDMARSFSNGRACVVMGGTLSNGMLYNGKYGYIDTENNLSVKPSYTLSTGFQEGYAVVEIDAKTYGFIDTTGALIKSGYTELYNFSEGFAIALDTKTNTIGHINTAGDWEHTFEYGDEVLQLGSFHNGFALIVIPDPNDKYNKLYGYINTKGETVISPEYEDASNFSEGLARVQINGLYGFINAEGKMVVEPRFENVGSFMEGMAIVKDKDKYGYIDANGEVVVDIMLDGAGNFSEDLASVVIDQKVGFIDKTGSVVIEPKFDKVLDFSLGYAAVVVDGKAGFIDKKGEYLIKPTFEVAQSFVEVDKSTKWLLM